MVETHVRRRIEAFEELLSTGYNIVAKISQ
jgi:hypothetical protein